MTDEGAGISLLSSLPLNFEQVLLNFVLALM